MIKKIVYVVGGLTSANGMSQVLSQKINYLAENTDYRIYMVLTEKKGESWIYKISEKVSFINFDINFDELDTMPLLKKLWCYKKKESLYKKLFSEYLMDIKPDITVSACRREINFINDINDGSKKIGEIHFNRLNYRKLDKKYLPTFLNKLISNLWIGQFIRQIKRLDKFIVLSEEDKSYWKGIDNIIVINNPIKLIPSQYSSCKNKFAIAVGRYTDQKGFDLLIKIWKIVEKKHPDWYLNIYGSGNKEIYEEIALNLKVKNISFNSPIDNIYEKYQKSSIFLLSSRYEGFALVLAEAMSCGLPVISFDCPCGPKDIINNGINGILVKTGDIIDFANQICNIIENENKRREMGEIARNIVSKFNENDIMRQWISLFNQLTQ
jgi:glycosyltransferase involved in cell wall biosynthesis